MLEKVSTILKMADESNTAVISFICTDYNMVYSVVTTAEKTNTPALVMLLPEHYEKNNTMNVHGFAEMVKELAESVKVPIGLHLDHSYDYDSVITSIKKGFDSVMIDASAYSLDENIALTRKVTETAHILGADVEAEIGRVGGAEGDYKAVDIALTSVEEAKCFAEETKVDALAVAIGTAHGNYKETPKLRIDRLKEIAAENGKRGPGQKISFAKRITKYWHFAIEHAAKHEACPSAAELISHFEKSTHR